eukprot:3688444-Pleurochrysis_carterae.AAC.2
MLRDLVPCPFASRRAATSMRSRSSHRRAASVCGLRAALFVALMVDASTVLLLHPSRLLLLALLLARIYISCGLLDHPAVALIRVEMKSIAPGSGNCGLRCRGSFQRRCSRLCRASVVRTLCAPGAASLPTDDICEILDLPRRALIRKTNESALPTDAELLSDCEFGLTSCCPQPRERRGHFSDEKTEDALRPAGVYGAHWMGRLSASPLGRARPSPALIGTAAYLETHGKR